jgi:hypothetical protein
MKKWFAVFLLLIVGAGLAFGELESNAGIYGGFGNASAWGMNLQLGYMSPQASSGEGGLRWGALFDGGLGGLGGLVGWTYDYTDSSGVSQSKVYLRNASFDYNLGVLGELYFLPFMGAALGGGIATLSAPYVRAEAFFLFRWVKLRAGFDYLFWKDDKLPAGVELPPGWRFNFTVSFRNLLGFLFL